MFITNVANKTTMREWQGFTFCFFYTTEIVANSDV